MKKISYINRAATRRLAIGISNAHRNGKFRRVSSRFLNGLEARFRVIVESSVRRHPSRGKTLLEI